MSELPWSLCCCVQVVVDMREFRSSLPSLLHKRGMEVIPLTLEVLCSPSCLPFIGWEYIVSLSVIGPGRRLCAVSGDVCGEEEH